MTPKQAFRFMRNMNAAYEDPMTVAYGAGEFVGSAMNERARKLGTTLDEIGGLASDYIERRNAKRNAHKDPARLEWRNRNGFERSMRTTDDRPGRSYELK